MIRIPFRGVGAGSAPLTWGQRHIWQAMRERDSALPMSAVRPLSTADTVDAVAAELRFYLRHHHSMRTRLRVGGGEARQVVVPHGVQPLHLVDLDADGDPDAAAEAMVRRFEERPYDYADEQPLRAAVVRSGGVPVRLVMTMCHLAMDAAGAAVMFGSRDPRTGGLRAPITAMQPLALARWESTATAQRLHDAAMTYWGAHLRRIPLARFRPPDVPPPPQVPRYARVSYESDAIALAQQVVAARTGTSTAAVLLTAFAVALARVTGIHPVATQVTVNNRFRSRLAEVVAPVSQPGLCVLHIAGLPFDAAVAQVARDTIAAYKHAYYDRPRLNELIATVGVERGHPVDLGCVYNDRRPTTATTPGPAPSPSEVRAAVPDGRLRWVRRMDRFNEKLMLTVDQTPRAVRLLAEVDTHHLPPADLEALLRGVEAVLVEAAVQEGISRYT